ncbi:MAG: NAD(P)-binding domain-containing protein [Byssovorax sp.]
MAHPTLPSGPSKDDRDRDVEAPVHKTLFVEKLGDLGAQSPLARSRGRSKTVKTAEPTSDLTRFRGVVAAAIAGASVTAAAAIILPPPGGLGSPGALSRPHQRAKLECASCHGKENQVNETEASAQNRNRVPSSACTACHGPHGSLRPGHKKALEAGTMRCSTCHPIHRSDQGVTFSPSASPVRFGPGIEVTLGEPAYHPARPATVALPAAGSCRSCHDVNDGNDPIHRCLFPGQEALGDARPIVCFDEHQPALPDDGIRTSFKGRGVTGDRGVCAAQHGSERALAWEAAREVAASAPLPGLSSRAGSPWMWTGLGLLAAALVFGGVRGEHALRRRRKEKADTPSIAERILPAQKVRLPQIDTSTCLGCYACVDACPYDVLEVERYVAVVARPEACCGLTLCEQRCPNGSLTVHDGESVPDRPRLSPALESEDVPGLYLAGDITGVPLIKNAILQGSHAVEKIAASLDRKRPQGDAFDLLIIGAGPAGISAALKAKELDLSFEVIEQGTVAQSIQSFPRGKLVFDQPLDLPLTGKLWLKESTKEELLSHWLRIVRKEKLPITADTRMTDLRREGDGLFRITSEPREGGPSTVRRARRVLLAIGQRGTPRRLPFELSPEVEPRVHYHLSDARSFEGKRVVVIGLGDVAMETAVALARQPSTRVVLVHRAEGFTRGKARNIAEVKRLVEAGRIEVRWKSEAIALTPDLLHLRTPKGEEKVGYDAVMVMIGSIPKAAVLEKVGIKVSGDPSAGAG